MSHKNTQKDLKAPQNTPRTCLKTFMSTQGLSQYFKNAFPKQQLQNFCPSRCSYIPSYFKSLYQLHSIAFFVKKGNLHFSYVFEDVFYGKDLVITSEKLKLKDFHGIFCLSKKEIFRNLPVQKTGWTGPG